MPRLITDNNIQYKVDDDNVLELLEKGNGHTNLIYLDMDNLRELTKILEERINES